MSDDILRARAGDREAFVRAVAPHRGMIERYVIAMAGDPAIVEDVLQSTLVRALEKIDTLVRPEKLSSWLLTIACNLCRARLRKLANADHPAAAAPLEGRDAGARRSALSSVVDRERADLLAAAIDRLPIALREAFVLHHVEGLAYADVAEIVGAEERTLQVRGHRARALLKRELGPNLDTIWREKDR